MYKLLALDLDGTTLNSKHTVDEDTAKSIQKIISKGIKVTIISGREPKSIVKVAEKIGLEGLVGSMNGAIITTSDGVDHIMNLCLPRKYVEFSVRLALDMGYFPMVFVENNSYIASRKSQFSKVMDKFSDYPAKEVGNLDKYLSENNLYHKVNKVVIAAENEELVEYKKEFENATDACKLYFSLPFVIEVSRKDTSKGKALEYIANSYGIDKDEIIAVGDGENDISMLGYSGKGIAMKNAMDNVKEVADELTDSNDKKGVVKVIEKYFL
ncbi:Cof-type HAD-IIB family hydrolase [Miniphocaeibacter massiliensis]|uniref:Cof-type HAD-IIB family hydrolase n=1 Tax=Miniphocaeibacter massiliensis TaxID=2041841 RepID=UPI000C079230|nr:Cof-type HAD-IIB family hydrolase [Miniphocaeibacter massiliensis]